MLLFVFPESICYLFLFYCKLILDILVRHTAVCWVWLIFFIRGWRLFVFPGNVVGFEGMLVLFR